MFVAIPDCAVFLRVEILGQGRGDDLFDLLQRGPDLGQHDGLAVGADTDRLAGEIDVERAGQGVRDDEWGRGEVRGAHLRVHASLEVAVTRQDSSNGELVLGDRGIERLRQRARVTNAGRAAVANEVEAQLVEWLCESRLVEIVGDDARAWCEAGLDPWLRLEPTSTGVARQETSGNHHGRVRRVGARGNRSDHDAAVVDGAVLGRRGCACSSHRDEGRDRNAHR